MGRPRKEDSLTPQDVTNAALSCLDNEGEAGLGVNRVARALGIKPPAIYKHVDGNAGLRQAAAISIWCDYLTYCQQQTAGCANSTTCFYKGAQAARSYAKRHPARYCVMMQYQMRPTDPEEGKIIQRSLSFFQNALQLYELSNDSLVDCMRMVNAAIYGFIMREQLDLMTLTRSADDSYQVMLDALLVAISHIKENASQEHV